MRGRFRGRAECQQAEVTRFPELLQYCCSLAPGQPPFVEAERTGRDSGAGTR